MSRRELEEAALLAAGDREAYLRSNSGLPGPRGNLELIDVASAVSDRADLERWAAISPEQAPENTPDVFLVCVGIVGLGRLVAGGDRSLLPMLRRASNDPRWRVREAVAIGLQAWGDVDPAELVGEMERWAAGAPLEGRAAMAALCEPRLLREPGVVSRVLAILDRLTMVVRNAPDPRAADVRILRQALGYGWSVAVVADVEHGLPVFSRWLPDRNPDVHWIVRQNLGKARFARAAPGFVRAAAATQAG
jgi:hypothetical protein